MLRKELNERSPVRLLEASIHGGLGAGNIGVIIARHGVGKTAFVRGLARAAATKALPALEGLKFHQLRILDLVAQSHRGQDIHELIDRVLARFAQDRNAVLVVDDLQMLVANPALVTRDMIEDVLKFKRIDGVDAALKKMRDAIFPGGKQGVILRDAVGKVKAPIQIISGSQDRIVPAKHAEGLPGNVKVHSFANTGHMPHMEAASDVNRLIVEIAK